MANQLEGNNTQQKLIGGAARQPQRQARNEDVFVANVGEKRYLWTARAFAIITAISLCCNIVLILAIMQVLPLYRVEPFLLTFQNKEEQVYNIQPIKGRMEDQKAITEVFVRQYVLLRSSFDRDVQEMEARWMPGGPRAGDVFFRCLYRIFGKNGQKSAGFDSRSVLAAQCPYSDG